MGAEQFKVQYAPLTWIWHSQSFIYHVQRVLQWQLLKEDTDVCSINKCIRCFWLLIWSEQDVYLLSVCDVQISNLKNFAANESCMCFLLFLCACCPSKFKCKLLVQQRGIPHSFPPSGKFQSHILLTWPLIPVSQPCAWVMFWDRHADIRLCLGPGSAEFMRGGWERWLTHTTWAAEQMCSGLWRNTATDLRRKTEHA